VIRDIEEADLAAVLAMNNAHAAEVNALTAAELAALVRVAVRARIVEGRLGFLIGFSEQTPAQGPNHGWFVTRGTPFLYVDRVVVAATARGRHEPRWQSDVLEAVDAGRPLVCEVNVENAPSLAFHARLGFVACGEAVDPRNGKRVRYLSRGDRAFDPAA
jgi:predicted GNAT superfamily acetyltransferase